MIKRWDFHIHSDLSPCADDEMTPNNIVNMALIKGLSGISITDHNSIKNLIAIEKVAKDKGLDFLPGVELTTKEEIHVLIYFESMDQYQAMDTFLSEVLPRRANRPGLFGHQRIYDENDRVIGEEENLLMNATSASLEEAYRFSNEIDGLFVPAHIDRSSFSILSNLGFIPPHLGIRMIELSKNTSVEQFYKNHPWAKTLSYLKNSDAHHLVDLLEGTEANCFDIQNGESVLKHLKNHQL